MISLSGNIAGDRASSEATAPQHLEEQQLVDALQEGHISGVVPCKSVPLAPGAPDEDVHWSVGHSVQAVRHLLKRVEYGQENAQQSASKESRAEKRRSQQSRVE